MEFVQGENLSDLLCSGAADDWGIHLWKNRLDICQQIAAGMQYLHSRDPPIFHLDLKSGNILVKYDHGTFVCKVHYICFHMGLNCLNNYGEKQLGIAYVN